MNKDLLLVLERTLVLLKHQATEEEIRAVVEMMLMGMFKNGELTPEAIELNKKIQDDEDKPRIIV